MIGPWCFMDRFGPMSFAAGKPMDVGAHPHTGIQTVSWILEGEVVHHDSLGNEAALSPGGVNVMTAGAGIAMTGAVEAVRVRHRDKGRGKVNKGRAMIRAERQRRDKGRGRARFGMRCSMWSIFGVSCEIFWTR